MRAWQLARGEPGSSAEPARVHSGFIANSSPPGFMRSKVIGTPLSKVGVVRLQEKEHRG